MYASVLSALLLGVWPLMGLAGQSRAIEYLAVAPPAHTLTLSTALSASGILVMDAESGQPVYAKQAAVRRPMASITKLMTALLIVENHELDEVVTISKEAAKAIGNIAYLPEGEHFTVEDLLSAILIASANDAAIALAEHHSGSVDAFVLEMNERAQQLGLKDTSYADPIGLDHATQFSTPRDIAWLTKFVLGKEEIAKRMQMRGERMWSLEGTEISLSHTHALLHTSSEIIAGKTGTTDMARQCLVSIFEEDGRNYIAVLLYSIERYQDMKTIMNALSTTLL